MAREVSFAKFLFLPSWFATLLEANFSCFAKIIWMPSWFAKLLELLLVSHKIHRDRLTSATKDGSTDSIPPKLPSRSFPHTPLKYFTCKDRASPQDRKL
jgi:hypothetical protein